jgi:histidyl-tRNA synthetase
MSEEKKDRGDFLQAPRGMKDLMGDDFYNHQGFFEKAQEICEYYGFSPLRTPVLEHEEVFMKGVGEGTDIVDKEIYSLRTKGGDRLALRPEGTAPAMRVYIEHGMQSLPQPVKFYYFGPNFRHDKPQKGRYREFDQFGIETLLRFIVSEVWSKVIEFYWLGKRLHTVFYVYTHCGCCTFWT